MSFSLQVKKELSQAVPYAPCCEAAQAYGLLLFGRHFACDAVSILTEHECVANTYERAMNETVGAKVRSQQTDAGNYIISAATASGRRKILKFFSSDGDITLRVNRANLPNESPDELNCCFSAFLRGAFLSCGTISDPNKNYHLEFDVPHKKLAEDLIKVISEVGFTAKLSGRRGSYVVYFKESGMIEDMLTFMGAPLSSMEFMQITMYKSLRNKINRRNNFDTANISRTADAAAKQIAAIQKIMESGKLDSLPLPLRQVARMRIENCDMSLSDIGSSLTPPVSRSGVNHRLAKIISIADNLEKDADKTQ
ncbi:MAG: DNA-binding protein WhiA, partial [Clostridia bacterium]|nr:DNA-binding protein WhiA [Clostridia bacterium]